MGRTGIVVLGGYGGAGRALCRELLRWTDVDLVIAGRNAKKAEALRGELEAEFSGRNIAVVWADASNAESLSKAFAGARLVVDASTAVDWATRVARAALATGADYLDLHFEQQVVGELQALKEDIVQSGRVFITQAGFHPGMPAAFVRHAATRFDVLTHAVVAMAMDATVEKKETVYEIVDLIAENNAEVFANKAWRPATSRDAKRFDLGPRFGVRSCYPIPMPEMSALPILFPLEETGVYAAGFNWFVDWLVIPLAMLLSSLRQGLGREFIARLLVFGLKRFSKRNRGVAFVLEAQGTKDGQPHQLRILAEHDDVYAFTAIPVVACIRQYLHGRFQPGLWMIGHAVDPEQLMNDMQTMGVTLQYVCGDPPHTPPGG